MCGRRDGGEGGAGGGGGGRGGCSFVLGTQALGSLKKEKTHALLV